MSRRCGKQQIEFDILSPKLPDPNIRARYFINRGDTFSRLKRTLGRWLLQGLDALDNIASVFNELIKNLVQIKPNRSSPRRFTQKPHFSHEYKNGV